MIGHIYSIILFHSVHNTEHIYIVTAPDVRERSIVTQRLKRPPERGVNIIIDNHWTIGRSITIKIQVFFSSDPTLQ